MLKAQILEFDRMITVWHRSNETSKRLDEIPGVGPALATALVASVVDPKAFRSGRDFSAWIGLVPKQHSSRGRDDRIAGGPLPIALTDTQIQAVMQAAAPLDPDKRLVFWSG